jgi:hypothetical protein
VRAFETRERPLESPQTDHRKPIAKAKKSDIQPSAVSMKQIRATRCGLLRALENQETCGNPRQI